MGEAGVAELTLTNDGMYGDVYRLTVETEFHQQPLPSRIVVSRDENRFQWRLDRGL